jgi:ubiquinone/menaquinone biosynthesis C-methylase UbiE
MITREKLYEIYGKVQAVVVPSLRYSQYLYEDVLTSHVNPTMVWLDLGCGHRLLPSWRASKEKELCHSCQTIIGLDYCLESLKKHESILYKVRGDASHLPFNSNSFDLITANMVVEHFDNAEVQFQEIHRLLKPGGVFIFHTPNVLGYTTMLAKLIPEVLKSKIIYILHGPEEDIFPAYYKINSEFTIKKIAQLIGFRVLKIKMIVTSAQFAIILPIAILELLWIKMLMTKSLNNVKNKHHCNITERLKHKTRLKHVFYE